MMKEHGKQLKAIRHLLEKTEYKDDSEEEDVSSNGKAVEDDQPDLFSIRRSPLYQAKIIQRQLNDPLLRKNNDLKMKMKKAT